MTIRPQQVVLASPPIKWLMLLVSGPCGAHLAVMAKTAFFGGISGQVFAEITLGQEGEFWLERGGPKRQKSTGQRTREHLEAVLEKCGNGRNGR
jgi:hypothetical protein